MDEAVSNSPGRSPGFSAPSGPGASRTVVGLLIALILLPLAGCGRLGMGGKQKRVALVLSVGGLGDKSFNDSAHEGLMRARRELDVHVFEGQPTMMAEDERYLRTYAARGFDLVIGVGFLMKAAVVTVARDFPKIRFALLDADLNGKTDNPHGNIATLRFNEHEGSFLVGAAAAIASKTGTIGFVGGMEMPLIQKFRMGYEEGARHVRPDIRVISQFAGSGPEAFADPVKGKQLAEGMIGRGADVLFHAAGSTGNGVIEAAREYDKLAIGVDSNQDAQAPGTVLTSMIKRVDVAVFAIIKEMLEGRFAGKSHHYGLEQKAVGATDFKYMRDPKLTGGRMDADRMRRIDASLESLAREIVQGKVKVSNYEELH